MAGTFSRAVFWGIVCALCAYGVFFIYSTGYIADEYPVRPNWWRQLIWLAVSAVAGFTVAAMNPRGLAWRMLVLIGYGASVVLLVLTLLFGRKIGGATRWLAIGPLLLQPAEFAKFFTLMMLCDTIVVHPQSLRGKITKIICLAIILALPLGLIIAAPSFGNAFSIIPAILCVFGIRYLNRRVWALLVFLGVAGLLFSWHTVLELRKASEANNTQAAQSQDFPWHSGQAAVPNANSGGLPPSQWKDADVRTCGCFHPVLQRSPHRARDHDIFHNRLY